MNCRHAWRLLLLVLLASVAACRAAPDAPPPETVTISAAPTLTMATAEVTVPSATSLPMLRPSATAGIPATATAEPTPVALAPTATAAPAATPCGEPGRIETGFFDTAQAGPLAYRIYLPPCYGLDGHVYPALYLLGGNIHDDRIWDVLGADETAEAGIMAGELQPLIIVMPDGGWVANQTSSGPASFEGVVLSELIPAMEQTYCIWPDAAGRAIGGLSRGGYWALEIAFRHPNLFWSVGAHSLALVDTHAGPSADPVQTGVTNDLGALRIWLDIGERDPYLVQARPLHDALVGADVDHVWRINPGQHEEAYWVANLPAYLAWYNEGWDTDRAGLPLCAKPD